MFHLQMESLRWKVIIIMITTVIVIVYDQQARIPMNKQLGRLSLVILT